MMSGLLVDLIRADVPMAASSRRRSPLATPKSTAKMRIGNKAPFEVGQEFDILFDPTGPWRVRITSVYYAPPADPNVIAVEDAKASSKIEMTILAGGRLSSGPYWACTAGALDALIDAARTLLLAKDFS